MDKCGLSYIDALEKAVTIVKRDAEHFEGNAGEFDSKTQVEHLMQAYCDDDPDTAFEMINAIEKNQKTLLEEVVFILKSHLIQQRIGHQCALNFADGIRFLHLMSKYQLEHKIVDLVIGWKVSPICLAFPEIEYNLKKENPSYCGLPDKMKKYKNFKREYDVDGIVALLPPNKKYGGFVKAFLNLLVIKVCDEHPALLLCGTQVFHKYLGELRKMYNSSIYSTEKRQEWFAKLGIQEEDCALWSRLFDQQYPGYKNVHKFFDQVA